MLCSPHPVRRVARVLAAAVAAGAVLVGCTVAVDGVPQVAEHGPADQSAVYAEWIANGWRPSPLRPISDDGSGVRAWLFGTARAVPAVGGAGYTSADAPASVVNWFGVFPLPEGFVADARQGAENTATTKNGRIVRSTPTNVAGHPALDVRIEFADEQGRPVVDLIRFVELPRHLVGVESLGLASDERVLQQVHRIVVDGLTVPPA